MKKTLFALVLFLGVQIVSNAQAAVQTTKKTVETKKLEVVKKADKTPAKVVSISQKPAVKTNPKVDVPKISSSPVEKQAEKKVVATKTATTTVAGPVKKDGTPDKRFSSNKQLKKDGTPDMRYKVNKQ